MFAEHAFDVKHLGFLEGPGTPVTPPREDRDMESLHPLPPSHVPCGPAATGMPSYERSQRLPPQVYRRRRAMVALVAAAALSLLLVVARPDQVPLGEANPWESAEVVEADAQIGHQALVASSGAAR